MVISEKLRELRVSQKLTQERAAELLGVSSQSVSKWERGIVSPDILLLPKIAVLYKTSIDAIFDMEFYWGEQHKAEFLSKVKALVEAKDKEGYYNAYLSEIELRPDSFEYYTNIMLFVLQQKLKDDKYISRMIRLSDYADNYCRDDDIRNEIHRLMLQICHMSDNPEYRGRVKEYYNKLSKLRHSREVFARFVMEGEEYRDQLKANIAYTADITECAVRQLMTSDMSNEEKLYYYQRAAALYEALYDGKYTGVYDVPLMIDYSNIAIKLFELGRNAEAESYIGKIFSMTERIIAGEKNTEVSKLASDTHPKGYTSPEAMCIRFLKNMYKNDMFLHYHKIIEGYISQLENV